MSSILLLGATGVTGLAFIAELARMEHPPTLTVLVRSRARVPTEIQARVVEGALDSEAVLEDALEGVDTVVSFLGAYPSLKAFVTRDKSTPIGDCFKIITRVMKAKGVKRILVLSTTAFGLPGETYTWMRWLVSCLPPIMVPQGHAEMRAIALNVASEDALDWTIFRVPFLTEKLGDIPVETGLMGPEYKGGFELTRVSLVKWVLAEIREPKWIRGAPVLGNV